MPIGRKLASAFGKDNKIEEKELTDMGKLAQEIQMEREEIHQEDELDQKVLNDIQSVSTELKSLKQDENEMRELLAEGITLGDMTGNNNAISEITKLAQRIQNEGSQLKEDFKTLKRDIRKQEEKANEIETAESDISALADQVEAEFQQHESTLENAEKVLNEQVMGTDTLS
jgi:chromosome segregation ATPase